MKKTIEGTKVYIRTKSGHGNEYFLNKEQFDFLTENINETTLLPKRLSLLTTTKNGYAIISSNDIELLIVSDEEEKSN